MPEAYRALLLSLAHEHPLFGRRFGQRRTLAQLSKIFYFPQQKEQVRTFVQSCSVCQHVGKPNDEIKAKLQPQPLISTPFAEIQINVLGPLPKTKLGKQFILSVICMATKYLHAIALNNVSAKMDVLRIMTFANLCEGGVS